MATASNTNVINFATGSAGDDATHLHLYDAATGGNLLWAIALENNPDALTAGQGYRIAAGEITITQNVGTGESETMATRALRGRFTGGVWVAVATGLLAANELTPPARVALTASDFTFATS